MQPQAYKSDGRWPDHYLNFVAASVSIVSLTIAAATYPDGYVATE